MAPEMYKGEAYDSRVDIYSLGIVLYKTSESQQTSVYQPGKKQLITYRDKENALNKRMAGEKLPRPAEAGDAFAEVILKACAFDREERYANAEEFREALERVKTGSSSAETVHVRKTQELEHAPGKINPQKVQHKSQQRTPQKDRKQAIQQSQMKAETEGQ